MTLSDEIKALVSTLEMQLNGFAKAAYAKDLRIADLERQLAEASDPAVEQQPVAQVAEDCVFLLRKQPNGDRWPVGTKLYTVPLAADAEKLREEILALEPEDGNGWDYDNGFGAAIRAAAGVLNPDSMAAQAPVREVPEGWQLVPKEPTQLMFDAARTSASGSSSEKLLMKSYWRNMLAAVPLPAVPVQQEGEKP